MLDSDSLSTINVYHLEGFPEREQERFTMSIETYGNGGAVITGKGIEVFRLATLLSGLKLELRCPGMKMTRGPKCTTRARQLYGLKGNAEKLIAQVEALLAKAKAETTYIETLPEGASIETAETV